MSVAFETAEEGMQDMSVYACQGCSYVEWGRRLGCIWRRRVGRHVLPRLLRAGQRHEHSCLAFARDHLATGSSRVEVTITHRRHCRETPPDGVPDRRERARLDVVAVEGRADVLPGHHLPARHNPARLHREQPVRLLFVHAAAVIGRPVAAGVVIGRLEDVHGRPEKDYHYHHYVGILVAVVAGFRCEIRYFRPKKVKVK